MGESPNQGQMVRYVLTSGRSAGQSRPAMVVRDWSEKGNGCVNLQVFLDGSNDTGARHRGRRERHAAWAFVLFVHAADGVGHVRGLLGREDAGNVALADDRSLTVRSPRGTRTPASPHRLAGVFLFGLCRRRGLRIEAILVTLPRVTASRPRNKPLRVSDGRLDNLRRDGVGPFPVVAVNASKAPAVAPHVVERVEFHVAPMIVVARDGELSA